MKRGIGIAAGVATMYLVLWLAGAITLDKFKRTSEARTVRQERGAVTDVTGGHTSFAITGCTVPNGNKRGWLWVSRDDNGDVTKGLPIEFTNISTGEIEPIATRESDGWHVRFKARAKPTP